MYIRSPCIVSMHNLIWSCVIMDINFQRACGINKSWKLKWTTLFNVNITARRSKIKDAKSDNMTCRWYFLHFLVICCSGWLIPIPTIVTSDCTNVTLGYHRSIRTFISNNSTIWQIIVLPRKLATGSIHDYLFCYYPLVGIPFEVLRINTTFNILVCIVKSN